MTALVEALTGLAGDVVEALVAAYPDEPDLKVVLEPGQTTTQDWCWFGCGQLYVRLDALYPSTTFPSPATVPEGCAAPLAARLHIGIHRCVAGPDNDGNPPDPAEESADALQLMADAATILCAVREASWFRPKKTSIGSWTPMGPFGNCAGGYWPITFRL